MTQFLEEWMNKYVVGAENVLVSDIYECKGMIRYAYIKGDISSEERSELMEALRDEMKKCF